MSLKDSLSIMIVDDTSTSRGLLMMGCDELGIKKVDFRKDGESALQALAAAPVHLVISDYNMPGLNGLQLLKGLRANKRTQNIGFILVSGRIDKELITTGRSLGMNNYLPKPFTTAQLRTCIQSVVGPL